MRSGARSISVFDSTALSAQLDAGADDIDFRAAVGPLGIFEGDRLVAGDRFGNGEPRCRYCAGHHRSALDQQAEVSLAVADVDEQTLAGEIEERCQVTEHQTLGFEDARFATRLPKALELDRDFAPLGDGRSHHGVVAFPADHLPVHQDVFQRERNLSFDFEGHSLGQFLAVAEGKL